MKLPEPRLEITVGLVALSLASLGIIGLKFIAPEAFEAVRNDLLTLFSNNSQVVPESTILLSFNQTILNAVRDNF